MEVKLTYFKKNGTFYSSSSYESQKEFIFEIAREVNCMKENKKLPGLRDGADFIVLVECFGNSNNHPAEPGDQEASYCRRKLATKIKELTPKTISDKILLINRLKYEVLNYVSMTFPAGSKVRVDCERFRGVGTVDYYGEGVPFDKVPVKLENENVWWYSIDSCKLVKSS